MSKAKRKEPRPYEATRYGILNPWGDVWTPETFDTPETARRYLADFWRGNKNAPDPSKFEVVPVHIVVTPAVL